eukprot:GHVU01124654.1.p2 GENE.GHVU01124654.1~~GHVU01124654.1.p2  ORF type:complete len:166 (+),score=10.98 GHVU01124654.1:100-597(+)
MMMMMRVYMYVSSSSRGMAATHSLFTCIVWLTTLLSGGLGSGLRHLHCLRSHFVRPANHVKRHLRQVVHRARQQVSERSDCVLQLDKPPLLPGEHFRDGEGLTQHPLDLPGSRDSEFVRLGELVHPQDGDDVLQGLVVLQSLLHLPSDVVVFLSDDLRRRRQQRH